MDFDWKDLGTKVAALGLPILGTALGGPAGATVGALVASVISKQLTPETPVDALQPISISQAIDKYGPQAVEALKAELEHDAKVKQIVLDTELAYLADKASARAREVSVVQATGKKDINLYVLAWVIIGGFLGTIIGLIAVQLYTGHVLQNDPLLTLLLGSLSTDAGMVVGYFFGSSLSSSKKDEDRTKLLLNSK